MNQQRFQMMFARCLLKVDLIAMPSTNEVWSKVKAEPVETLHLLNYGLDHRRQRGLLISRVLKMQTVRGTGIEGLQSLQASQPRRE